MTTIKIGKFPGEINEFVLEEGTTVKEALKMAHIEVEREQEVKMDGAVVDMDSVANGSMLLVTKRLKGAVA